MTRIVRVNHGVENEFKYLVSDLTDAKKVLDAVRNYVEVESIDTDEKDIRNRRLEYSATAKFGGGARFVVVVRVLEESDEEKLERFKRMRENRFELKFLEVGLGLEKSQQSEEYESESPVCKGSFYRITPIYGKNNKWSAAATDDELKGDGFNDPQSWADAKALCQKAFEAELGLEIDILTRKLGLDETLSLLDFVRTLGVKVPKHIEPIIERLEEIAKQ